MLQMTKMQKSDIHVRNICPPDADYAACDPGRLPRFAYFDEAVSAFHEFLIEILRYRQVELEPPPML